jgi:head-tail adaptor
MLREAAIRRARVALAGWMETSATVLHRVQVSDGAGGFVDTYVVTATYSCYFGKYPVRPLEREAGPLVQATAEWRFAFPVDADIRRTDRIEVGTRTFEVVDAGMGTTNISRVAICLEIT